jgi:hypothetical protein
MTTPPTIDLSDIFTSIDQHSQTFLSRLIDYVRQPSISAYGEGIGEVTRFFMGIKTGTAMLSYLGAMNRS